VRHARETALAQNPLGGTTGLEIEWNLLDASFQPLQRVGAGRTARSFADVLREDLLPDWLAERTQLEVFHWMIEWTTRPHLSPWLTVAEARILEACQINILHKASHQFGERLHGWHGNLLARVNVGHGSIPGGWNLAKRRYLERCVDLYGASLATAGIHVNLTLPEPLLAWDFMHRPAASARHGHLDSFKNRVYIDLTRRMRAFSALFIATSASTPLRLDQRHGRPIVRLSSFDSMRSLIFPSPEALDLPGLYRSYKDYLRLSYDLVRRGVRFGNNNWTPVRARSFAEPVERLISVSSDQLEALYRQGLYAPEDEASLEAMARRVVEQNLRARIDLPMARVELRTDEGGHPFDLDVANLTLKELLLLRLYADRSFGRPIHDDQAGMRCFRRNETAAARGGLRAKIEDPFDGRRLGMRSFLKEVLEAVGPLADALGVTNDLAPLRDMAEGGPNTAERLRAEVRQAMGRHTDVRPDVLRRLAQRRDLWDRARDLAHQQPGAAIRFRPAAGAAVEITYPDKTAEIVDLARSLIRIPSVSGAPPGRQRPEAIHRAATLLLDTLQLAGLDVRSFESGRFPSVLARFPGSPRPPVLLSGHFDVVEPDPDDSQFEPRLEGDYLWGRGAADMKTVVATYVIWMKDARRSGGTPPPIGLLLVGNEEIGENEPDGTPHVLAALRAEDGYSPRLLIAGERTGEEGDELFGRICLQNRGLLRLEIALSGSRAHTGFGDAGDLEIRLLQVRRDLEQALTARLALPAEPGWSSQVAVPFIRLGEAGIFNVSADQGVLGVEVRPIPDHPVGPLVDAVRGLCDEAGAELRIVAAEDGIACDPADPFVAALLAAVRSTSGKDPILGRKLAATSARFAPGGQGVVWGQSGIGPHARDERHYIPSIEPYYRALQALAVEASAVR
jgi:acetylornithine deacetylase/succinyl-diaminopimelate desuccinylase-like protein/gamma-glutamyl:cysteine ligase YbdK (ATP-grasp superfamily)